MVKCPTLALVKISWFVSLSLTSDSLPSVQGPLQIFRTHLFPVCALSLSKVNTLKKLLYSSFKKQGGQSLSSLPHSRSLIYNPFSLRVNLVLSVWRPYIFICSKKHSLHPIPFLHSPSRKVIFSAYFFWVIATSIFPLYFCHFSKHDHNVMIAWLSLIYSLCPL